MRPARPAWAGLCALLGACATAPGPGPVPLPVPNPTAWLSFQPLPRSLLVSRDEPAHAWARLHEGGVQTTVLARRAGGAVPVPAAVLVQRPAQPRDLVAVQWLPAAGDPVLDVLALEHLYALALRQEPTALYCLARAPQRCDPAADGAAHGRVLLDIAQARDAAVVRAGLAASSVPWRSIAMAPAWSTMPGPDDVAVRVLDPQRQPLPDVTVYFNRAPHSGCGGRSDHEGRVRCTLVDQHGDSGDHQGHAHGPVVVTFPGDVRRERVLLPTTYVLPAGVR